MVKLVHGVSEAQGSRSAAEKLFSVVQIPLDVFVNHALFQVPSPALSSQVLRRSFLFLRAECREHS